MLGELYNMSVVYVTSGAELVLGELYNMSVVFVTSGAVAGVGRAV